MLDRNGMRWIRIQERYKERGGKYFEQIVDVLPESLLDSYPTSTIIDVMLAIDSLLEKNKVIEAVEYRWPENPLDSVLTVTDAAEEWGKTPDWFKLRCGPNARFKGGFEEGTQCRKSKGSWLISRQAIVEKLGESKRMKSKRE